MTKSDTRTCPACECTPDEYRQTCPVCVAKRMAHARRMEALDGIPPVITARWDETLRGLGT
jgi:hypothetical protein